MLIVEAILAFFWLVCYEKCIAENFIFLSVDNRDIRYKMTNSTKRNGKTTAANTMPCTQIGSQDGLLILQGGV